MTTFILIALALLAVAILIPVLIHRAYRAPRTLEQKTPEDLGLGYQVVRIKTENNKHLFAWYIPSTDNTKNQPAIVIIHGWGGNAGHMLPFAAVLHQAGYTTLLVEARNHGNSDSDSFSSMPRFAEDLEHGVNWLSRQPNIDPKQLFLLGHSVGAGAALLVASRRADLAGVISVSAFSHPVKMMRKQFQINHIPYIPFGWLLLRFIEKTIKVRFDDIAPCNTINKTTQAVLLVHGEEDDCVSSEDAQQIYANRPNEKVELLLLPKTGHDSRDAIFTHGENLITFLHKNTLIQRPQ